MNDNKLILLHDPKYTHVSKDTVTDVENEVIKVMGYKIQPIQKMTLYKKMIKKMCFKFPSIIRLFRKKDI